MALPHMTPFPEVFRRWNSHMVLIPVNENTYHLEPQNQLDWFYTLKKVSSTMWRVKGKKQAYYDAEETCDDVYEYENGRWRLVGIVGNEFS